MTFVKILSVTVVATLATMAFVIAPSAMAEGSTLLCENASPAECSPNSHLHFLSVNSEGTADGKGKLLAGSNTVECNLLVLGDVIGILLSSPVQVLVDLTYTNCNLGCSVASPAGGSPHGIFDFLRLGSEGLADVKWLGIQFKMTCPFVFTCDYNSENLVGHGLPFGSAGKGHITFVESTVSLESKLAGPFNCPTTKALDLLLQSLTPLYVRE